MLVSVALAMIAWLAPASTRCADIAFTPSPKLQIVGWVETAAGAYVDTVYITQTTGRFGLGNRPGRFDFNSGPMFPYGRRTTTFPVWSHRHGHRFPSVIFQNSPENPADCESLENTAQDRAFADCGENNLSHPFTHSSTETYFCQPFEPNDPRWQQADAMSCATVAYTDKGRLSMGATTTYPPRADLAMLQGDLPSVGLYKMMNPFDAVSQATPAGGVRADVAWPIPDALPNGDYVLWLEVGQEQDHNSTYSVDAYPAPPAQGTKGISWASFGVPYRGQPSVLYKVPFTIGTSITVASTQDWAGYGAPDGTDGSVRPQDSTISTQTPNSGALRLQLVSDNGSMYRVRVRVRPNIEFAVPGVPERLTVRDASTTRIALSFIAPAVDGGRVAGYDVRILANEAITAGNFDTAIPITAAVAPNEPGRLQTFEVMGVLPETEYWIGVRAYDACRNGGELAVVHATTADRETGEVDACFIATAAYGSVMASDVELLRHARDSLLARSVLGELAIETYYTFGPAIAGVVGESEMLRRTARVALAPLIEWVRGLAY